MSTTPMDLAHHLATRARIRDEKAQADARRARDTVTATCRTLVARGLLDRAWLIGSSVWGGFGERSDIDIVVEGCRELGAVILELEDACPIPVDLLEIERLTPAFQARVRREGEAIA